MRHPRSIARVAAVAAACALASCATTRDAGHDAAGDDLASRCTRAYRALDDAVARAGLRDAMSSRIAGFPHLRADRLLASFAHEALAPDAFEAWIEALRREDASARLVEIANLPPEPTSSVRDALARDGFAGLTPAAFLEGCGNALAGRDAASAERRALLRGAATVPDDYSDAQRALGLYPLAAPAFALAVRAYEAGVHETFAVPLASLAVRGTLRTYAPLPAAPSSAHARALVRAMPRDALGVPRPSPETLDALFAAWAPRLVVDEKDGDDRLGRPVLTAEGATVDTSARVVYTRAAATRFGGRVLLQLVYSAWFPARPPRGALDILAGPLDALVWRVTLDDDGDALAFDAIHACGCYALFFPTGRLVAKPAQPGIEEGALAPQPLPEVPAGTPVALRLESGSHALQRVVLGAADDAGGVRYALAPEDALRTLPHPAGGTRSLYGEDGIVPGTGRAERLLLWPLGIADAGAMRQWGRHATAFVGRRHFDEPFLLERYFIRAAPAPVASPRDAATRLF